MNTELLGKVAAKITTGYELMGSKWQNCECETIAMQTISACATNFKNHGDAFSWLGRGALRGRAPCGINNAQGLGRLLQDGSLTQESYEGPLSPPDTTAAENGLPQILRVTDALLEYADKFIKG